MSRGNQSLRIELDERMVKDILSDLSGMPKEMKKAQVTAVRRTMRTAETRTSQTITKVANLNSKAVKGRIRQKRSPTNTLPQGILTIIGKRISLWNFSRSLADAAGFASQRGTPVKSRKPKGGAGWKIYKGEKTTRAKNFFVRPTGKRGQLAILKRPKARGASDGGDKAVAGKDYRIAYGPSLPEIMKAKNLTPTLLSDITDVLVQNLRSQVDRFLKRRKSSR